jgi:pimeloyl-ACP methyl ester carboxylesterase
VVSEAIDFSGAGVRLSGTLWLPDHFVGHGLLLIGGSGRSDRHNDGLFDALSEYLVAQGVAVLAYDKRGAGSSSGWWADAGVEALAADARCALDVLRAHRCVAPAAVGVFGHSEGGWVAMRVGAQEPTLAHVVLNSCPAVSLPSSPSRTAPRCMSRRRSEQAVSNRSRSSRTPITASEQTPENSPPAI